MRLALVAFVTGLPALVGLLGLSLFFVPLSLVRQTRVWLSLPPLLLGLSLLWTALLLWRTRPLERYSRRYLQVNLQGATSADPSVDQLLSAEAYRTAQALPYLLGLYKVVLGLLGALLLGLLGIWRWGLDVNHTLGAGWNVSGKLRGQYANDALIPGEQFGIGGTGSVRGLRDREATGDRGYTLNLEATTPPVEPRVVSR